MMFSIKMLAILVVVSVTLPVSMAAKTTRPKPASQDPGLCASITSHDGVFSSDLLIQPRRPIVVTIVSGMDARTVYVSETRTLFAPKGHTLMVADDDGEECRYTLDHQLQSSWYDLVTNLSAADKAVMLAIFIASVIILTVISVMLLCLVKACGLTCRACNKVFRIITWPCRLCFGGRRSPPLPPPSNKDLEASMSDESFDDGEFDDVPLYTGNGGILTGAVNPLGHRGYDLLHTGQGATYGIPRRKLPPPVQQPNGLYEVAVNRDREPETGQEQEPETVQESDFENVYSEPPNEVYTIDSPTYDNRARQSTPRFRDFVVIIILLGGIGTAMLAHGATTPRVVQMPTPSCTVRTYSVDDGSFLASTRSCGTVDFSDPHGNYTIVPKNGDRTFDVYFEDGTLAECHDDLAFSPVYRACVPPMLQFYNGTVVCGGCKLVGFGDFACGTEQVKRCGPHNGLIEGEACIHVTREPPKSLECIHLTKSGMASPVLNGSTAFFDTPFASPIVQSRTIGSTQTFTAETLCSSARVVGGVTGSADLAATVIALKHFGRVICSGVVIANNTVITAAHCISTTSVKNYEVCFGVSLSAMTCHDVVGIRTHVSYIRPALGGDLAVLHVSDVTADDCVELRAPVGNYSDCWAAGYGVTSHNGELSDGLLVVALSHVDCETETTEFVCAWNQGADTCQGDSGGMLACQDDNGLFLAGVVSHGYGCATARPGYYTRTAKYLGWLRQLLLEGTYFVTKEEVGGGNNHLQVIYLHNGTPVRPRGSKPGIDMSATGYIYNNGTSQYASDLACVGHGGKICLQGCITEQMSLEVNFTGCGVASNDTNSTGMVGVGYHYDDISLPDPPPLNVITGLLRTLPTTTDSKCDGIVSTLLATFNITSSLCYEGDYYTDDVIWVSVPYSNGSYLGPVCLDTADKFNGYVHGLVQYIKGRTIVCLKYDTTKTRLYDAAPPDVSAVISGVMGDGTTPKTIVAEQLGLVITSDIAPVYDCNKLGWTRMGNSQDGKFELHITQTQFRLDDCVKDAVERYSTTDTWYTLYHGLRVRVSPVTDHRKVKGPFYLVDKTGIMSLFEIRTDNGTVSAGPSVEVNPEVTMLSHPLDSPSRTSAVIELVSNNVKKSIAAAVVLLIMLFVTVWLIWTRKLWAQKLPVLPTRNTPINTVSSVVYEQTRPGLNSYIQNYPQVYTQSAGVTRYNGTPNTPTRRRGRRSSPDPMHFAVIIAVLVGSLCVGLSHSALPAYNNQYRTETNSYADIHMKAGTQIHCGAGLVRGFIHTSTHHVGNTTRMAHVASVMVEKDCVIDYTNNNDTCGNVSEEARKLIFDRFQAPRLTDNIVTSTPDCSSGTCDCTIRNVITNRMLRVGEHLISHGSCGLTVYTTGFVVADAFIQGNALYEASGSNVDHVAVDLVHSNGADWSAASTPFNCVNTDINYHTKSYNYPFYTTYGSSCKPQRCCRNCCMNTWCGTHEGSGVRAGNCGKDLRCKWVGYCLSKRARFAPVLDGFNLYHKFKIAPDAVTEFVMCTYANGRGRCQRSRSGEVRDDGIYATLTGAKPAGGEHILIRKEGGYHYKPENVYVYAADVTFTKEELSSKFKLPLRVYGFKPSPFNGNLVGYRPTAPGIDFTSAETYSWVDPKDTVCDTNYGTVVPRVVNNGYPELYQLISQQSSWEMIIYYEIVEGLYIPRLRHKFPIKPEGTLVSFEVNQQIQLVEIEVVRMALKRFNVTSCKLFATGGTPSGCVVETEFLYSFTLSATSDTPGIFLDVTRMFGAGNLTVLLPALVQVTEPIEEVEIVLLLGNEELAVTKTRNLTFSAQFSNTTYQPDKLPSRVALYDGTIWYYIAVGTVAVSVTAFIIWYCCIDAKKAGSNISIALTSPQPTNAVAPTPIYNIGGGQDESGTQSKNQKEKQNESKSETSGGKWYNNRMFSFGGSSKSANTVYGVLLIAICLCAPVQSTIQYSVQHDCVNYGVDNVTLCDTTDDMFLPPMLVGEHCGELKAVKEECDNMIDNCEMSYEVTLDGDNPYQNFVGRCCGNLKLVRVKVVAMADKYIENPGGYVHYAGETAVNNGSRCDPLYGTNDSCCYNHWWQSQKTYGKVYNTTIGGLICFEEPDTVGCQVLSTEREKVRFVHSNFQEIHRGTPCLIYHDTKPGGYIGVHWMFDNCECDNANLAESPRLTTARRLPARKLILYEDWTNETLTREIQFVHTPFKPTEIKTMKLVDCWYSPMSYHSHCQMTIEWGGFAHTRIAEFRQDLQYYVVKYVALIPVETRMSLNISVMPRYNVSEISLTYTIEGHEYTISTTKVHYKKFPTTVRKAQVVLPTPTEIIIEDYSWFHYLMISGIVILTLFWLIFVWWLQRQQQFQYNKRVSAPIDAILRIFLYTMIIGVMALIGYGIWWLSSSSLGTLASLVVGRDATYTSLARSVSNGLSSCSRWVRYADKVSSGGVVLKVSAADCLATCKDCMAYAVSGALCIQYHAADMRNFYMHDQVGVVLYKHQECTARIASSAGIALQLSLSVLLICFALATYGPRRSMFRRPWGNRGGRGGYYSRGGYSGNYGADPAYALEAMATVLSGGSFRGRGNGRGRGQAQQQQQPAQAKKSEKKDDKKEKDPLVGSKKDPKLLSNREDYEIALIRNLIKDKEEYKDARYVSYLLPTSNYGNVGVAVILVIPPRPGVRYALNRQEVQGSTVNPEALDLRIEEYEGPRRILESWVSESLPLDMWNDGTLEVPKRATAELGLEMHPVMRDWGFIPYSGIPSHQNAETYLRMVPRPRTNEDVLRYRAMSVAEWARMVPGMPLVQLTPSVMRAEMMCETGELPNLPRSAIVSMMGRASKQYDAKWNADGTSKGVTVGPPVDNVVDVGFVVPQAQQQPADAAQQQPDNAVAN